MQKTRRQILDILKRKGSATLDELAGEIGLSAVTIRAHLALLERDDLITSEEVRGKVGRPHFVYSLAAGAEEHFPMAYHQVAHRFLDAFKKLTTEEQLGLLVEQVADRWAAEQRPRLSDKPLEDRVAEVVRIRNEEGVMAEWQKDNGCYVIHQHHCPASRLAQLHPEVCMAELEYMRRLLNATVDREGAMVGGLQKCSYRVSV